MTIPGIGYYSADKGRDRHNRFANHEKLAMLVYVLPLVGGKRDKGPYNKARLQAPQVDPSSVCKCSNKKAL